MNTTLYCDSLCIIQRMQISCHVLFIVTAFIIGYNTSRRLTSQLYNPNLLLTYPGHDFKWAMSLLLSLILMCSLAEGIMTDQTRNYVTDSYLYINPLSSLFSLIISLVYYQKIERWNRPHLVWLLLFYWIICIIGKSVELSTLTQTIGFRTSILRFDLYIIAIAFYTCCLAADIYILKTKIFRPYREARLPSDLFKSKLYFRPSYSNLLSRLTIHWWPLSHKDQLDVDALGSLPEEFECKYVKIGFEKALKMEQKRDSGHQRTVSVWRTSWRAYMWEILAGLFEYFLTVPTKFLPPLLIARIIKYANQYYYKSWKQSNSKYITLNEFFNNGFILIAVICTVFLVCPLLISLSYHTLSRVCVKVKVALQILIYDKALKLSLSSMSSGDTTGQIVNLISVDVAAVQQVIQHMAFIIATPINLILSFAFLVWKLGIVAVMSLAVFLIVIPLQIRLIRTQQIAQNTYLLHADARIKKATEILQSVKILKMYGWEELFASTIKNIRGDEMKQISVVGLHTLFSGGIAKILPVIIPLVIFVLHLAISSTPLTPDLVFTVLPLANMLIEILYMVPFNIACVTEGLSSVKRIECFLSDDDDDDDSRPECYKKEDIENDDNIDEVCEYLYLKNEPSDVMPLVSSNKLLRYDATSDNRTSLMVKTITEPGTAVKIENGNFGWGHSENILALKNISIDIPTGKLTMVIGKIASGKSSLIMALLGEITGYSGSVEYRSRTRVRNEFEPRALYHIEALGTLEDIKRPGCNWIINDTRLKKHVDKFQVDFEAIISLEKINIGQLSSQVEAKDNAKISYASQTAWLLNATLRDNIIFWKDFDQVRYNAVLEACALKQDIQILPGGDMTEIGARGINLSGGQKQRISLARALYAKTDVVILDDPLSALDVHVGDYVMKEAILNFLLGDRRTVILATHHYKYIEYANKVVVMENGQISHQGSVSHIQKNFPELFEHLKNMFDDNNSDEDTSRNITSPMGYSDNSTTDKTSNNASLVVEEEQQQGPISWSTLYEYANFLTIPMVLLTLLLLIICTGAYVVNYLWLSKWAQAEQNNILSQVDTENTSSFYLSIYALLCFFVVVSSLLTSYCQIKSFISAAGRLHIRMLYQIIHAPMRFFDTTPTGRILNRFANDTMVADLRIWMSIDGIVFAIIQILTSVIVNTIVNPLFSITLIPFVVVSYLIKKYYLGIARDLQRLDCISKSPVLEHFTETLGGLPTIRAYRLERRFQLRLHESIERNSLCQIFVMTSTAWIANAMLQICNLFVLTCGMCSLLACVYYNLEPSFVGLAITTSITVYDGIGSTIYDLLDYQTCMNSVERIIEYTHVPSESYKGSCIPHDNWPDTGSIELKHVSARYAETSNPVLHNITLQFKPGEKIGICGRTGSGKSSLSLTLIRMIDVFQGQIIIDGIDISQVPLLILRKRMSIIPQDPHLFAGTIRFNLDPEGRYTNEKLWNALHIAQLKDTVEMMRGRLDEQIPEGGDTFSAGQKQLFCLARAFLRKSRILIMDEATSSIDFHTDAILQNVISTSFADKTVLTIAHRISTILESDTILVLSDGEVIEYDTPTNLLKNNKNMFASLVNASQ